MSPRRLNMWATWHKQFVLHHISSCLHTISMNPIKQPFFFSIMYSSHLSHCSSVVVVMEKLLFWCWCRQHMFICLSVRNHKPDILSSFVILCSVFFTQTDTRTQIKKKSVYTQQKPSLFFAATALVPAESSCAHLMLFCVPNLFVGRLENKPLLV